MITTIRLYDVDEDSVFFAVPKIEFETKDWEKEFNELLNGGTPKLCYVDQDSLDPNGDVVFGLYFFQNTGYDVMLQDIERLVEACNYKRQHLDGLRHVKDFPFHTLAKSYTQTQTLQKMFDVMINYIKGEDANIVIYPCNKGPIDTVDVCHTCKHVDEVVTITGVHDRKSRVGFALCPYCEKAFQFTTQGLPIEEYPTGINESLYVVNIITSLQEIKSFQLGVNEIS